MYLPFAVINCQGNQCNKWLNRAGMFRDTLPQRLKIFGNCLLALAKVVKSCFGNVVIEGWQRYIQDFQRCYKKLKITWTPTIHSIITHVRDFYFIKGTAKGLGYYSEQATEHSHTAWDDVWTRRRFKRDYNHPKYAVQLKSAMATFNSEHI